MGRVLIIAPVSNSGLKIVRVLRLTVVTYTLGLVVRVRVTGVVTVELTVTREAIFRVLGMTI